MKKNIFYITTFSLFLLLFVSFNKLKSVPAFSATNTTKAEIKDELIISFFITDIDNAVQKYYSSYFSIPLEVYNYEVNIVNISKANGIITITFGITPQIGAHNPVGYDEVTFQINSTGKKELISYEHINSYSLDGRFSEYIIAPLPE